jgi:non-heme chloroperoxidase
MKSRVSALIGILAVVCVVQLGCNLGKKDPGAWHDPSPHRTQFIAVDKKVRLEVLDWGGSGRPLILLAGLGHTAHIFDDFAPKLTAQYHVYGITRRGCGASSIPEDGYSADRLGDDVLAVLDALRLKRPVLVGHSIAGVELSSVAARHPEKISGLIYLEAGYSYAFYDTSQGDFVIDLGELIRKLEQFQKLPGDAVSKWQAMVDELLQKDLPLFEKHLKELQKTLPTMHMPPPPQPDPADMASFAAYHSWFTKHLGLSIPESELRQHRESNADGSVGKERIPPDLSKAIAAAMDAGEQKYTEIKVPVLAIYAVPLATSAADTVEAGVPGARVVRLQNANHYIFISNEADVLREIEMFLVGLP